MAGVAKLVCVCLCWRRKQKGKSWSSGIFLPFVWKHVVRARPCDATPINDKGSGCPTTSHSLSLSNRSLTSLLTRLEPPTEGPGASTGFSLLKLDHLHSATAIARPIQYSSVSYGTIHLLPTDLSLPPYPPDKLSASRPSSGFLLPSDATCLTTSLLVRKDFALVFFASSCYEYLCQASGLHDRGVQPRACPLCVLQTCPCIVSFVTASSCSDAGSTAGLQYALDFHVLRIACTAAAVASSHIHGCHAVGATFVLLQQLHTLSPALFSSPPLF